MQRLFLDHPLSQTALIDPPADTSHYLLNVLRMKLNDTVLVFNGIDGEWLASINAASKKHLTLRLEEQVRAQTPAPDLHYCFAPLKVGRLDYMIQKAVEMGAAVLQPVLTQHCQMGKINRERLQANAREAAEQCGILSLPECRDIVRFERFIDEWDRSRSLIFCDESASSNNPLPLLQRLAGKPAGVLIGPEGGFSDQERQILHALPFVTAIPLGPRILRADTAAVAAMAVIQASIGDWN